MDNSLPFEVVCVRDVIAAFVDWNPDEVDSPLEIGKHYNVDAVEKERGIVFYHLVEKPDHNWYGASCFRRISPYQNSVSRSLAEQALKDTGDSRQDMKPERKEVEV